MTTTDNARTNQLASDRVFIYLSQRAKMQTTIESQDRRFRAVLTQMDDGVRVQLLRDAGTIDGRGPNARIMWRQLQVFTLDKPFHRVADKAYDLVWPMTDDRPKAWPTRNQVLSVR